MIEIKKGREPRELMAYRKMPFASYDEMPKDVHDAVINSLMQEQGYICAYCMRRIPQKGKDPDVTIEHLDAQSLTDVDRGLDYRNMVAVCNGNRGAGSKDKMTCDAKRGNDKLTVNPLQAETLSRIQYKKDGTIYSDDPAVKFDVNETLNLNCPDVGLIESRHSALQALQKELSKRKKDGDIKLQCARMLQYYQQQNIKTPYVGILIWWLKKKISC